MNAPDQYDVIVVGDGRDARLAACPRQAARGARPRQDVEGRVTWRGHEGRAWSPPWLPLSMRNRPGHHAHSF